MQKELVLSGTPIVVSAPDDDFYLATMPVHGPTDLEAVFRAFCGSGGDVIDVGANIGITAILLGKFADPGTVVAIEPLPVTFEHLKRNLRASGLENVKSLRFAAAAHPGNVTLVSRPGFGFAAYVGRAEASEYTEFPTATRSLDQVVENEGLRNPHFVKIDVEGFELEVLRGAARLLESFEPVVLLESNHYCLNVFRHMSLPGFLTELQAIFPFVFALDFGPRLSILDLTNPETLPGFFHDSIVNNGYPNLLCGFSPEIRGTLSRICEERAFSSDQSGAIAGPPLSTAKDHESQGGRGSLAVLSIDVSPKERDLLLFKRRMFNLLRRTVSHFRRT